MNHHDILISDGGELKSLGDGRIGGWAVVFGDETKTDKSRLRDFMTAETDYWIDDDQWGVASSPVIFHHGLDPDLKKLRLGRVTYTKKDAGIWAEGVLKLRSDYEAKYRDYFDHIKAMVESNKLGLSTGVPGHLVEREKRGNAHWLRVWPIERSELSLTPTPAEPRTSVFSLKSLLEFEDVKVESPYGKCPICGAPGVLRERRPNGNDECENGHTYPSRDAIKAYSPIDESNGVDARVALPVTLLDRSHRLVADTREVCGLYAKALGQRQAEGRDLSDDKRDALKAMLDEHRSLIAEIERLATAPGVAPGAMPVRVDPAEFRAIIERGRLASRPNRTR